MFKSRLRDQAQDWLSCFAVNASTAVAGRYWSALYREDIENEQSKISDNVAAVSGAIEQEYREFICFLDSEATALREYVAEALGRDRCLYRGFSYLVQMIIENRRRYSVIESKSGGGVDAMVWIEREVLDS